MGRLTKPYVVNVLTCRHVFVVLSTLCYIVLHDVSCEDGWVLDEINGYCFKVFEEALSWHASQGQCKQYDAELASIRSRREQEFMKGMKIHYRFVPSVLTI